MAAAHRGIFIVFEGVDGAGKSTQVQRLAQTLTNLGYDVATSREPTDGVWGKRIRDSAVTGRMPLDEELDAFVHDRQEHITSLIGPQLQRGSIVIVDRYFYSTITYQGSRGADQADIDRTMRAFAPIPDIVLLLDADPTVTLERISQSRGDTPDEFEHLESLQQIRNIFLRLANECPEIRAIDAHQSEDAIHASILNELEAFASSSARDIQQTSCSYRNGNDPWPTLQEQLSTVRK